MDVFKRLSKDKHQSHDPSGPRLVDDSARQRRSTRTLARHDESSYGHAATYCRDN